MRMNLTEEEAKLILRMREIEDAHRKGWDKALLAVETRLPDATDPAGIFYHTTVVNIINSLKKEST